MVEAVDWAESFRIIASRFPFIGIFDRISEPADLEAIVELEARTNPRIRDELGEIGLVRSEDRIYGVGTTPIMAAFTHSKRSRFNDGSSGVYYAAFDREVAVCETVYHIERFYRDTKEASADVDMRSYTAVIRGQFDDIRQLGRDASRLDPESYGASRRYASALYAANAVDGILYRNVRDDARGECVVCFRPKSISACRPERYRRITGMVKSNGSYRSRREIRSAARHRLSPNSLP